jgi:DNA-binding CsgD family transcriptional regulator
MEIVGRDTELAAVDTFLSSLVAGPAALVLTGPAGMGKTTVWRAGVERARGRDINVALTSPTEAEATLPFAGLNDLVGAIADSVAPDLPEPQRLALEVALLRRPSDGDPPQPLAVALGVLELLRAAARQRPLLLAIDDVTWLDASTAAALEFALRRLDRVPIGLLVTHRTTGPTQPMPALAGGVGTSPQVVVVEPLSDNAIDRLVVASTALAIDPAVLRRIRATAGGNPFYALEIVRALERNGVPTTLGDLPIPDSLSGLVRERIEALADDAREVVLHASALATPTRATLRLAIGTREADHGIAIAIEAGILEEDAEALRFAHPLLATEVYRRASTERRRAVHALLAEVVPDDEERARHIGLAAAGPDPLIGAVLERSAAAAWKRGASQAAAEIAERAIRLTPPGRAADVERRTFEAARYHLFAGNLPRAREHLERILEAMPAAPSRARALVRLGEVRLLADDWRAAKAHYDAALRAAPADDGLRMAAQLGLAGIAYVTGEGLRVAPDHIAGAMATAERLGDPALLVATIGHFARWEFALGRGFRRDLMERAAELERWIGQMRTMDHPDFDFAKILYELGEREEARHRLQGLVERAGRVGDVLSLGLLWSAQAYEALHAGAWDQVEQLTAEAERLARQTGQRTTLAEAYAVTTALRVRRGDVAGAEEAAAVGLELAREIGFGVVERDITWQLGVLRLSVADATGALESFDATTPGVPPHRAIPPWQALEDVEALVASGRLDEAGERLAVRERDPRRDGNPWYSAAIARARGLLHGALQELDEAISLLDEAIGAYERLGERFELARTLVMASEVRRRARRKRAARDAATRAVEILADLGSAEGGTWQERATQQLSRTAGRRTDAAGLTATQEQVAELVVAGRTNREIADALYMSVHTVEAHLTTIYRTVGVRSRGQLAGWFRQRSDERHAGDDRRDSHEPLTPHL